MRRIGYGLIFLLMFCFLFTGCAAIKPVDLNPKIQSGQLVQKTDNFLVLFDKSASTGELHVISMLNLEWDREPYQQPYNVTTRLIHAKKAVKDMIAAIPDIKLNAGLRTFWYDRTALIYGMKPLVKEDYTRAINSIEQPNHRTPMAAAITAAGSDLKGAPGNSALIIVSDFADMPGIDDIRPEAVMKAITQLNAEYGDRLCVYAIQTGYAPNGKDLSEQIVQNVAGGYTVNADRLLTPAAMSAFVERVIAGKCERYPELVAKAKERVVVAAAEPMVEEKVVAAVSAEKIVVLAFEDIHFDFDKSTLKPEAKTILKRNIQLLKDNPKAKVRIAGYTSASGTDAYNQSLSERRANAVEKYLIEEGIITKDRLSTIGYGEANPAMYEAAPKEIYSDAAKANMRVLFEITVR